MTQKEIHANNCLIAEFMGGKTTISLGKNITWDLPNMPGYQWVLFYNSSWDWLMPVVEKIESLGFWTNISAHTSFDNKYKSFAIKRIKPKSDGEYVYNYEGDWNESKIEAVYQGVIEFIKWFNEHQKENM